MQAIARSKYVRVSQRKISRVLNQVKGLSVNEALNLLHFVHKSATTPIEKAIRSAVANLGNIEEGQRLDLNQIFLTEAYVDQGPKRFRPMSMGRAGKIRKRTSHLTVIVEDTK
jgi:large subunit ribosomal protein L22